jgi:hypothetical protein
MACSSRKKLVRRCRISVYEEQDDIQCMETREKYVNPSILIYAQLKHSKVDIKCDWHCSSSEINDWWLMKWRMEFKFDEVSFSYQQYVSVIMYVFFCLGPSFWYLLALINPEILKTFTSNILWIIMSVIQIHVCIKIDIRILG